MHEYLLTPEDFANPKNQLPLREFRAILALGYPQFGSAVCEIARFLVTLPCAPFIAYCPVSTDPY